MAQKHRLSGPPLPEHMWPSDAESIRRRIHTAIRVLRGQGVAYRLDIGPHIIGGNGRSLNIMECHVQEGVAFKQ